MSARQEVGRMLALVPYLQGRTNVPVTEVAEQFDVSPDELQQMLWRIFMCGLPGGMPDDLIEIDMDAVEGRGVINLSNADYLTRPMRFTGAEIAPLLLGLELIRDLAGPESVVVVDQATAKLRQAAGDVAAEADRLTVEVNSGDGPIRAVLIDAIDQGERVQLTYDSATTTERTVREVDPAGITIRQGYAYLEAFSLQPPGWRTFRLDRIVAVHGTGISAVKHADRPAPAADWAEALSASSRVRVRVGPNLRWLVDQLVVDDPVEGPDGVLEVTFGVGDGAWLTRLLLQYGDALQPVESADADDARQLAQAALAAYRDETSAYANHEPLD